MQEIGHPSQCETSGTKSDLLHSIIYPLGWKEFSDKSRSVLAYRHRRFFTMLIRVSKSLSV